jgi:hypothetical protein
VTARLPAWPRRLAIVAAMLLTAACGANGTASPATSGGPGFLGIAGRNIVDSTGAPVVLRGVNFKNEPAMACCGADIAAIYVGAADYATISGWGANVVRFGLDYAWYAAGRDRFFSVLDEHVREARQNHLWTILALYAPPGGSTGGFLQHCLWSDCAGGATDRRLLVAFWKDVAHHYASDPTVAGYDLVNEPAPPAPAEWYALGQQIHDAIAAVDPHHLVIFESTSSGLFSRTLRGTNIVYSDHLYAPMTYTTPHTFPSSCTYPGFCEGTYWDRSTIEADIRNGEFVDYRFSVANDVPVLVGEFGARKSPGYVAWVSDQEDTLDALGIGWIVFTMRERGTGFGLYTCITPGDLTCPDGALIAVQQRHMAPDVRP